MSTAAAPASSCADARDIGARVMAIRMRQCRAGTVNRATLVYPPSHVYAEGLDIGVRGPPVQSVV